MSKIHKKLKAGRYSYDELVLALKRKQDDLDINEVDDSGHTLLHIAVRNNDYSICMLLLKHGADPNYPNCPVPSLILAAANGQIDICKLLVDYHADINKTEGCGMTPLMVAARGGHIEVCKFLGEVGADKTLCSKSGRTAYYFCSNDYAITKILDNMSMPAKTNKTTDGDTVLMTAIRNYILYNRHKESSKETSLTAIKMLLLRGHNPADKNKRGVSALDLLREQPCREVIELIEEWFEPIDRNPETLKDVINKLDEQDTVSELERVFLAEMDNAVGYKPSTLTKEKLGHTRSPKYSGQVMTNLAYIPEDVYHQQREISHKEFMRFKESGQEEKSFNQELREAVAEMEMEENKRKADSMREEAFEPKETKRKIDQYTKEYAYTDEPSEAPKSELMNNSIQEFTDVLESSLKENIEFIDGLLKKIGPFRNEFTEATAMKEAIKVNPPDHMAQYAKRLTDSVWSLESINKFIECNSNSLTIQSMCPESVTVSPLDKVCVGETFCIDELLDQIEESVLINSKLVVRLMHCISLVLVVAPSVLLEMCKEQFSSSADSIVKMSPIALKVYRCNEIITETNFLLKRMYDAIHV